MDVLELEKKTVMLEEKAMGEPMFDCDKLLIFEKLKEATMAWDLREFDEEYLPIFSMFYYYPKKNCSWELNPKERDDRYMIWNFKNTLGTSYYRHATALNKVLEFTKIALRYFFANDLPHITFVCVNASSQSAHERRYKEFSERICLELGMENAYTKIIVAKDGTPKHLGKSEQAVLEIDEEFFRGRNVLLFDDIITSGQSLVRYKRLLTTYGANVIGALTIGKTMYNRVGGNPIETIMSSICDIDLPF